MKLLYQLSLYAYQWLIALVSPFNGKAKQFRDGRKNIFNNIALAMGNNSAPVAWFHCASVGEFEQARPVMELFKLKKPDYKICLTFFSPSGYELRKNYAGADWIFYLPVDSPANAKQFVDLVKPSIALFTKYEFWYFYLKTLHEKQIPMYSFSAIFREKQVFFKPYGAFYRRFLQYFDHIFVQDDTSLQLLQSIGVNKVSVAGDTRFDRVAEICANKKDIPLAQKFKGNRLCMVIGSSWPQDMEVLLPLMNNTTIKLKYIIAPHEIHASEITALMAQIGKKSIRFSEANENDIDQFEVLWIDNIGMLSSLYQYGEMAYVGGAFGKGLHNVLEPATFGMPVFFGPKYAKFNEAIQLIKVGGGFSISSSEALESMVKTMFQDGSYRNHVSQISRDYVLQHTGGSKLIVDLLCV
jgi:3-deoxy-D-manno-octulosonic-acid transferase